MYAGIERGKACESVSEIEFADSLHLLYYLADNKKAVTSLVQEIVKEIDTDIQATLQLSAFSLTHKQQILGLLLENNWKGKGPCEILRDKYENTKEALGKVFSQLPKAFAAQHADTLAVIQRDILALDQGSALTLVPDGVEESTLHNAISFEALVELFVQHCYRIIICIHTQVARFGIPVIAVQYTQAALNVALQSGISMVYQRWLEYNFTQEQWKLLLERQYNVLEQFIATAVTFGIRERYSFGTFLSQNSAV